MRTVDRDQVVVIQHHKLAQPEVARQRAGFAADALLQAPVTTDDVGEVVADGEAVLVVLGSEMGLGDGKTNGVGDTCVAQHLASQTRVPELTHNAAHLGQGGQ